MKRRPFVIIAALLLSIHWITQNHTASPELAQSPLSIHRERSARLCGRVVKQTLNKAGMVLVVDGEIHVKGLPADETTVLLRVSETTFGKRDSTKHLEVDMTGCRVVANILARKPDPPPIAGEFNEEKYASAVGATLVGRCFGRDIAIQELPGLVSRTRKQICGWIEAQLDRFVGTEYSPIAMAVLIGDKARLTAQQNHWYSLSGTAHMFSVSGSHVALVALVVVVLLGGPPRSWIKIMIFLVALWIYVWISNMPAASVRAALMASAAVFGLRRERSVDLLNILAAVVVVVLVFQTDTLLTPGFVLSVSATAAILILTPQWSALFDRCAFKKSTSARYFHDALSVNIAATVGTVVPIAYLFGIVSVVSPAANLVVVPLLSLGMILSLSTVFFAPLVPYIAGGIGFAAQTCLRCANDVANVSAGVNPVELGNYTLLMAFGMTLLGLWPLISKTWTQLMFRLLLCITYIAWTAVLLPATVPSIQSGYIQNGIKMKVHGSKKNITVILVNKKGFLNVRIIDDKGS
ncbi:MAG: ComEC/Rec2 family competence protein [Ignavibacteria bacterium]|nr:ComEC/Rec2 family competence protein [Ignavibacteria bacterium]